MKNFNLKSGLLFAALGVAVFGFVLRPQSAYAFEAHVIQIRATLDPSGQSTGIVTQPSSSVGVSGNARIENAIGVDLLSIEMGVVHPQEIIEQNISIILSDAFLAEDRVRGVTYDIIQKPNGINPVLCPYLAKLPQAQEKGDIGVSSPHESQPYPIAHGRLDKAISDRSDQWRIVLKVPGFEGEVAQDYDPQVYGTPLSQNLKGQTFGCDLWVEVKTIINEGTGVPVEFTRILHSNAPSSIITAPTISDPVNSVFGNYLHQAQDIAIQGPMPLGFVRTYNSQSEEDGALGAKWTHNYNIYLKVYDDGVVVVNGDGRWDVFMKNTEGSYVPQAGVFDTLTKEADNSFILAKKDQTRYRFTDAGRLVIITDKNGNGLNFTYDENGWLMSVGDDAERKLLFFHGQDGKIVGIADPADNQNQYSYDDEGNLIAHTDPMGRITRYTYDSSHNLLTITDPNSNVLATNEYDEQSRVVAQKDARGNQGLFSYGEAITRFTNALGNSTFYHYDDKSRVVRIVDAQGGETQYSFDENNNKTAVTDSSGNITAIAYDARGNVLSIVSPLSNTVEFSYDDRNNLVFSKDARGNTATFSYDDRGNLTAIIDALGNTTIFSYSDQGDLVEARDAVGNATSYEYDAAGNITRTIDPLGNATTYAYDNVSRLTGMVDALNNTTTFEYDALGRLLRLADPLQHTLARSYDGVGNITEEIDPNGKSTRYSYDAINNLVQVEDAMANSTSYEYDAVSNLTRVIDANAAATTYAYDPLNRPVVITDPLGKEIRYAYDPVGNVITYMNGVGETVLYEYDALGRLVRKTLPDGSQPTRFAYDENGNLVRADNSHIAYEYGYDALDRMVRAQDSRFGTMSYEYDAVGNRVSLTDSAGHTTQYTYTPRNQVSTLTDFSSGSYSFRYDMLGRRTGFAPPNGVTTNYAYDAASRLTRMESVKDANDVLVQFVYSYDARGNRVSKEDTKMTASYEYDPLSQLTNAMQVKLGGKEKKNLMEQYAYDPVGNRLVGPKRQEYAYNSASGLLRVDEKVFTYDGTGNVITQERDDAVWGYGYDAENRLIEAVKTQMGSSTEKVATYFYDPFGRRIKKVIENVEEGETEDEKIQEYLYDNEDIVAIYDGKGRGTFFVHGPGIDEPLSVVQKGETYYYLFDGLGSVTGLTDNEGKIVQQYEYDSFGNLKQEGNKVKQPYAFTGREFDKETGLYFYRARYYDPTVGKFVSRDPVVGFISFPQSLNRYQYVYNNPVGFIDPSGEWVGAAFAITGVGIVLYGLYEFADFLINGTNEIEQKLSECSVTNMESCTTQEELVFLNTGGAKDLLKLEVEGFDAGRSVTGTSFSGPPPLSAFDLMLETMRAILEKAVFNLSFPEAKATTITESGSDLLGGK